MRKLLIKFITYPIIFAVIFGLGYAYGQANTYKKINDNYSIDNMYSK